MNPLQAAQGVLELSGVVVGACVPGFNESNDLLRSQVMICCQFKSVVDRAGGRNQVLPFISALTWRASPAGFQSQIVGFSLKSARKKVKMRRAYEKPDNLGPAASHDWCMYQCTHAPPGLEELASPGAPFRPVASEQKLEQHLA